MIGHRGGVNVRSQEGSGRLPAPKYVSVSIQLFTEFRDFQDFITERP